MDSKLIKLSNNLKILSTKLPQVRSVTVLILVKTGSRYEEKETNGVAHFAEHMFFKGTKKRPTTLDISSLIDGVGGELLGENNVLYFEVDGLRVCHTGDLGHALDDEQVTELGDIDILLLLPFLSWPASFTFFSFLPLKVFYSEDIVMAYLLRLKASAILAKN